ncbi:MAG: PilZ domain-containing protein [Terracidiphilus sp.]|nr:PilZ domain-containing protein [Terracidiphilus sp.]
MEATQIVSQNNTKQAVDAGRKGADRRRSRRYPCEGFAEAVIPHPDILLRGEIRNVSMEGCFVSTRAFLHMEVNEEAEIRFTLRDRHYKVRAVVANVRPGLGVGLGFRFEDAQAGEEIRCLVEEMNATELRDEAEGRLVRGVGIRPEL